MQSLPTLDPVVSGSRFCSRAQRESADAMRREHSAVPASDLESTSVQSELASFSFLLH